MMAEEPGAVLTRALQLSRELLVIAESGDLQAAIDLGVERLRLLHSVRIRPVSADVNDQAMLKEIATLNDRALGFLEHRRRKKSREIDTAAVGRRAVAAYSTNRPAR